MQQAPADPRLHRRPGHSRASLGQSLVGSLLLSPGSWCAQGSVCACQESVSPVLWKFWRFCGGFKATSSKRAYAIPTSAVPRAPPLQQATLTRASTGDAQTQFWLRLCGVSGSWCAQGLFEPSECLWRVRGLIVSAISPLLPSCWGFLFALGRGGSSLVGSNILLPTVVQQ